MFKEGDIIELIVDICSRSLRKGDRFIILEINSMMSVKQIDGKNKKDNGRIWVDLTTSLEERWKVVNNL